MEKTYYEIAAKYWADQIRYSQFMEDIEFPSIYTKNFEANLAEEIKKEVSQCGNIWVHTRTNPILFATMHCSFLRPALPENIYMYISPELVFVRQKEVLERQDTCTLCATDEVLFDKRQKEGQA